MQITVRFCKKKSNFLQHIFLIKAITKQSNHALSNILRISTIVLLLEVQKLFHFRTKCYFDKVKNSILNKLFV